jgi:myo-inositol 2-dehydrogenase / D-chiro-inositol 1-dehydrogenase
MSPLKIIVIGCGWISQDRHGPAYAHYASQHPEVELAACCDVDPLRAEAFRARFGFQRVYNDYQQLLEAERPRNGDQVAVCLNVPEPLICEIGCTVMQRGFALLSEKPPGLSVVEIDRLILTARETGALHQVNFNRRFTPLLGELKRRLDGKSIRHIDLHFFRVGRIQGDFSPTAIHAIDTLRYLAGSDFAAVHCHYQELPEYGPLGVANTFLDCTFHSGATASLSLCPVSGLNVERSFVHTGNSTYYLSMNLGPDAPGRLQQYEDGHLALDLDGSMLTGSSEDFILSGFCAEDAAFFDDVQAGRRPVHNFASCRQSVEVMQALRERTGELAWPAAC